MRLKVAEALVGRKKESETLQSLCQAILESAGNEAHENATHQTCLVHGAAGSGKTSLIVHVVNGNPNYQKKSFHFLSCKFDQYQSFSAPYSEIVSAFEQLAASAPPDRLQKCLTTEAKILTRLIPSFNNLLVTAEDSTLVEEGNNDLLTLASERLVVAFQVFLREFCSPEHPIVLFVDDLQWSDENSCRLLGQIANDQSIPNFLFIGCYRDEEASNFDLGLEKTLHVTDLPLSPLDATDVGSLIGQIVEVDDDDSSSVSSLGHLVHRKTLGNPYFVVQFLEMLHSRELLSYNYAKMKWEFDSSQIATSTNVISDNVVEVLRARIELLSPQVQHVLIITAFLGFVVDIQLLESLKESEVLDSFIKRHSEADAEKLESVSIADALKTAEDEGLIERRGPVCRFSHDRIQEALYALVPAGKDRDRIHYLIGMHVWGLYGYSNQIYIFLAADQLNRGASTFLGPDGDRMFLVELNYKASLAAKSRIGIDTVGMFIEKAVEHVVDESYWERSYELLVDVYSFAAEVEFNKGAFDVSERHIETVLSFARQDDDTLRVLVARALAHGVKRDFAQGIRDSKNLLKLLGIKMPASSTLNFLIELFRTKSVLKHVSDDDFMRLDTMESENDKLAMKILQHGSIYGWNSDTTFAGLCYLRMMRLTMKLGWCDVTPYALSGYGFLLAALGEEKEAFRYSQLAIASSRRRLARPDVNMMVHSFLSHFELPASHSLKPLLAGYRSGLETGEMMCGSICMCCYCHVYLFAGLPLKPFSQDMIQFGQQLKLCHQDLALAFALPALQLALNLCGETSNPMDMTRESMENLDAYNDSMFVDREIEDPSLLFLIYLQAFSAWLLGDLDQAEKALNRVYARRATRLEGTQILNLFFILVDGLISFALCRDKPRRKYRKRAQASIRELAALVKKRSINCGGILGLLQAESASFSERKAGEVKEKYDQAIVQLSRGGFLHFAAIANELAGLHMLRVNDEYWATYYLVQAAKFYSDWGAQAKVDQMLKKHDTIDFGSERYEISGALQGRAQYDANVDSNKLMESKTGQLSETSPSWTTDSRTTES